MAIPQKFQELLLLLSAMSKEKFSLGCQINSGCSVSNKPHYHLFPELRVQYRVLRNKIQLLQMDWFPACTGHMDCAQSRFSYTSFGFNREGLSVSNGQLYTKFSAAELEIFGIDISRFPVRAQGEPPDFGLMPDYLAGMIRMMSRAMGEIFKNRLEELVVTRQLKLERKVRALIAMSYSDPMLTVGKIAQYFKVHPNYLSTRFKVETGETVHGALNSFRLERAAKLLLEPHLSISDVALRCGFAAPGYFATAFGRKYGVPPTVYRKKALSCRENLARA